MAQIIEKLNGEVVQELETERQVVYILVEIRKLVEVLNRKLEFSWIWTYASWAVHPVLKGRHGITVVEIFDRAVAVAEETRTGIGQWNPQDIDSLIAHSGLLTFDRFRSELQTLCRDFGIQDDWITKNPRWVRFLVLYCRIVEACPLRCESNLTKKVRAVRLRCSPSQPNNGLDRASMDIHWELELIDGESRSGGMTFLRLPRNDADTFPV